MEFEIKLTDPFRQSLVTLGLFSQPFEELACELPARLRTICNAVFKSFEQFNILGLRSAASVTVTERHHDLIRKLLRLKTVICALEIRCSCHRCI